MKKPSAEIDFDRTPKYALLVIDVQKGLFNKSTPIYGQDNFLRNLNDLIRKARENNTLIIFIQHSNEKVLVFGTDDWSIHPHLNYEIGDVIVHKQHGNSFEETNLQKILNSHQINSLVITGLVTHGCVKATCQGALELGYKVILVKDGHSSYSKDAADLIIKWNQELFEMGAELQLSADVTF